MVNKKKINVLQENIEDRKFKCGGIVSSALFIIGLLLLMFGIEEGIVIALLFSWVIFIVKMVCSSVFKGLLYKIINTIYWVFFAIVIVGLVTWIFNISPSKNRVEYNKVRIKNDSIGIVTNANIEKEGDLSTIKLVKPIIFKSSENVDSYVVYKIDNSRIMYLLYDSNIGLHIIYVGYSYLYIYSILLFLIIIGVYLIELFKLMCSKKLK